MDDWKIYEKQKKGLWQCPLPAGQEPEEYTEEIKRLAREMGL